MTVQENHKNQGIQVISRAAGILRILADSQGPMSLGQIARAADLPRSTVQRIVATLAEESLVQAEGGIRLGPGLQSLAQAVRLDRTDRLRPLMHKVAADTGETVDLAVMEGAQMRFIDQVVGRQRLRTVSAIGDVFPLTTTANGKAALACLEPSDAARLVLSELESAGAEARLIGVLEEIEAIRNGALATDIDEHTEGISAIGFAVRDEGAVHALSVPVPSSRFGRVQSSLTDVLSAARRNLDVGLT